MVVQSRQKHKRTHNRSQHFHFRGISLFSKHDGIWPLTLAHRLLVGPALCHDIRDCIGPVTAIPSTNCPQELRQNAADMMIPAR